jgi:acyl dehydratase
VSAERRDGVAIGDRLPTRDVVIDQAAVIRYAGASGDFNPLHWDPEVARRVSPTGRVIAHGMLNLAILSGWLGEWAGGAEHVRSVHANFKAPCPVGATVTFGGEVLEIDPESGTATIAISATTAEGAKVVDARASRAVVEVGQR